MVGWVGVSNKQIWYQVARQVRASTWETGCGNLCDADTSMKYKYKENWKCKKMQNIKIHNRLHARCMLARGAECVIETQMQIRNTIIEKYKKYISLDANTSPCIANTSNALPSSSGGNWMLGGIFHKRTNCARASIFMEIEKSSLTERAIGKAIYGRHYAGDDGQRWGRRDESTLHIF